MAATDLVSRLEKELEKLHVNLGRASNVVSNVESYNEFVFAVTSMLRTERSKEAIASKDPSRVGRPRFGYVDFTELQSNAIANILDIYQAKEAFMEGLPIMEQRKVAHRENVDYLVNVLDNLAYTQSYKIEQVPSRKNQRV